MTIFNAGKAIGPSFPSELQAAGLLGLPCAWGSDGLFQFDPRLTAAQITAIKAVITAHNPLTPAPLPSPNPLKALIDVVTTDALVPASVKAVLTAWKAQL